MGRADCQKAAKSLAGPIRVHPSSGGNCWSSFVPGVIGEKPGMFARIGYRRPSEVRSDRNGSAGYLSYVTIPRINRQNLSNLCVGVSSQLQAGVATKHAERSVPHRCCPSIPQKLPRNRKRRGLRRKNVNLSGKTMLTRERHGLKSYPFDRCLARKFPLSCWRSKILPFIGVLKTTADSFELSPPDDCPEPPRRQLPPGSPHRPV